MSYSLSDYGWCNGVVSDKIHACEYCGIEDAFSGVTSYNIYATRFELRRCPGCASLAIDPPTLFCSGTDLLADHDTGASEQNAKYYVEVGYSADFVAACALAAVPHHLRRANDAIFVDIGAGFGLGSLFVKEVLGVSILPVEPAYWGAVGARILGLPIQRALFEDLPPSVLNKLIGRHTLLHLNSVIEHLAQPFAAVRSIMDVVQVDVLAAVVPNGGFVNDEEPFTSIVGTLAPGDHLHLPTARGMTVLLERLGFEHTGVLELGALLIAVGSRAPVTLPTEQEIQSGAISLLRILADHPDSDVARGAAGRLLGKAVANGDAASQAQLTGVFEGIIDRDAVMREPMRQDLPYYLPTVCFHMGSHYLQAGDLNKALEWYSVVSDVAPAFIQRHPVISTVAVEYGWASRLYQAHIAAVQANPETARERLASIIQSRDDTRWGAQKSVIRAAEEQYERTFGAKYCAKAA